jgi:hypothetical protein
LAVLDEIKRKKQDQVMIEPTDATIIRCIFPELNQSQHVLGIIMPIIRRTRTRLVKTSCEDAWLCGAVVYAVCTF